MIGFAELAGFLFIVIFAIILAARWYVAVPCLLGEGLGPRKSLARSAMLTQGSRVRVLTLAFIIGLPWFLVSVVLVELSESYGSLLFSGIILLLDHIIGAYAAVTMTLLHRDLRRRREGPGRDELTAIFA
ncbi:MAG TPA: hypothetical protein VKT70_13665 [Stellaceae bacterium]|nr:hypothetical protein [Stellaceae bacterium]